MGGAHFRLSALLSMAVISLAWFSPGFAAVLPGVFDDCDDLGAGWQQILVSNQSAAVISEFQGGPLGNLYVCFNPAEDCYLGVAVSANPDARGAFPFMAQPSGDGVDVASAQSCGTYDPTDPEKVFDVRVSSSVPGGACLNRLDVRSGKFASGQLVSEGLQPAIMIETDPPILLDQFISGNSLNIPGNHGALNFVVSVPLAASSAVLVQNRETGELLIGGVANSACGFIANRQEGGVSGGARSMIPVPVATQWGLMGLSLAVLAAAVRITRRRQSK